MGKKKAPKKQPEFTAASTHYCDVCKINVKIGFGGEANWNAHLGSTAHKEKERAANVSSQRKGIMAWFSKAVEKAAPAVSKSSAAKASSSASFSLPSMPTPSSTTSFPPPVSTPIPDAFDVNAWNPPSPSAPIVDSPPSTSLLDKLEQVAASLPGSVLEATSSDTLAHFSGNPVDELPQGDNAWEMADRALNQVIGFGITVEEITKIIHRGPLGMDGLCRWLRVLVSELMVDEALLEGKINCLIEAVTPLGGTFTVAPLGAPAILDKPVEKTLFPMPTPVSKPCPGFHLKFRNEKSAFDEYSFQIHAKKTLPWNLKTEGDHFFLYSTTCSGFTKLSKKGKEKTPQPCMSCSMLNDHNIIMGICHRSELDNAHNSMPWGFLSPRQMWQALRKKTDENVRLKLYALNDARKIRVRNRHLSAWKRLSMAIGREDIPRIRSLMAAQHRAGSSVFTMLEKIDKATCHAYSPRGYEAADFERAFLIYKLGGRAAADIAHRSLGTPSIDATKRHIITSPIHASSGFPTLPELSLNLATCYPPHANGPDVVVTPRRIRGMMMEVDKLKIQDRLRWDPHSNHILGAMVIGASILSDDPNDYTTRPFAISGSCKCETVQDQERLLHQASEALISSQQAQDCRLYCITSDGDSRRCRALIAITLTSTPSPMSKLHHLLSSLPFFNLKCSNDELTCDFDWKHVLKRFHNTLLRMLKGMTLNGIPIIACGMPESTADALLAPNDKQDVVLMIKLLHSISLLPPASSTDSPMIQATRRVLHLLGRIYHHLLSAYLDVELSLHDQLVHLSAAAHLILAMYHKDKGDFIPVQTFFDVMSMIKNVHFCVAKTQIDDPEGSFWIILLRTDGLEKVFGKVRTMVGNDTNADQLQLANCIDSAVQCVKILELHPEWGGQARRLNLQRLPSDLSSSDISSKYDHINPRSWKGDVKVSNVVLLGSWSSGCRLAEAELAEVKYPSPFDDMRKAGGYDIMCPFGEGKVVLVDGRHAGEREETEEEQDDAPIAEAEGTDGETPNDNEDLDVDDIAGTAELSEAQKSASVNQNVPPSAWISIDPTTSKKVHKASVLRLYSNPLTVANSKDCLKCVRGYSQYNESKSSAELLLPPPLPTSEDENVLCVLDPALTVVHCNNKLFLAAFQVLGIRHDAADVQSLPSNLLGEPNVRIHGQIMKLSLIHDQRPEQGTPDWEWNGNFEAHSAFQDIEGQWVELIDPDVQPASRGHNTGKIHTFSRHQIFVAHWSSLGEACFACQADAVDALQLYEEDSPTCFLCPGLSLEALSGPDLLKHMGGHILHDPRSQGRMSPCGFCLNSQCEIFLTRHGQIFSIDMQKSTCPSHRKAHINDNHPTATVQLYESFYKLHGDEFILMKRAYLMKTRVSKKQNNKTKALAISAIHSSRAALQLSSTPGDNEGLLNDAEPSVEDDAGDELDEDSEESTASENEEDREPDVLANDDLHALPAVPSQLEPPTDDLPPCRKRRRPTTFDTEYNAAENSEATCNDPGCESPINESELLCCDCPGCYLMYHLSCRGLIKKPDQAWFCDNECRKNAGFKPDLRGPYLIIDALSITPPPSFEVKGHVNGMKLMVYTGLIVGLVAIQGSYCLQVPFMSGTESQTHYPLAKKPLISERTEQYIQTLLTKWNSSGISVAVVRKDENSRTGWHHEFGAYGVAKADGSPVTPDSLFAIASNSKLVLAFSVGLLISNKTLAEERGNEIKWSTKIRDLIPEWGLMDEDMDRAVTLQDMVSHRTGMPRHDFSGVLREGGVGEMASPSLLTSKMSLNIHPAADIKIAVPQAVC
ncbi:hypothetical protein CPB84DRAFT_1752637 [Gymnopilus junonius]|uniref:Beta-lactamase-related domain-containing protein n=1 Tax=Gymnopilus junonius TaxID=109634 RepID=A0A9P5NAI7_GYMJU|nr:hypothetical protein CPB84DRAFT_1752637 [Gymnopilus junonius]